ncbi:DUF1566 domain-containing protein [Xylophilus sp. Kf1]|nr:DUF1566 domain-containing protein [Xylophilus sp. Kf1]
MSKSPETFRPFTGFRAPAATLVTLAVAAAVAGCGSGGGGGGGTTVPEPVEPQPSLTLSSPQALESDGRIVFAVAVASAPVTAKTVTYSTSDLSAGLATRAVAGHARGGAACGAGIDYIAVNGASLTIPAGATSASIAITTCDDSVFQANKRFRLSIGGALNTPVAVGTIVNNDVGGLNDTGIASCLDTSGAATACPSNQPGQDGETGRDALAVTNTGADGALGFSFSRIATTGAVLDGSPAAWPCVLDKVTGLLWQNEQSGTPSTVTFTDLQARAATANSSRLCGRTDWRIPEVAELAGLVHAGKTTGVAIDSGWFSDTAGLATRAPALYWTNTTASTDTQTAWAVDFSIGTIGVRNKAASAGNNLSGRLVSGAAAPAASSATPCVPGSVASASDRFVANGDATVTDRSTQLMWSQCSVGQSGAACGTGSATAASFGNALSQVTAANAANFLGYSDWRLPNRNELNALVERACRAPAINQAVFPGTFSGSYWTSSPSLTTNVSAWYVDFVDGDVAPGDTAGIRRLRLVRAGQ